MTADEIYNEFMNKDYLGVRVTTKDRIIHAIEFASQKDASNNADTKHLKELLEAVRTNRLGQGCCTHFGVLALGGVQIVRCAVCEEYLSALG